MKSAPAAVISANVFVVNYDIIYVMNVTLLHNWIMQLQEHARHGESLEVLEQLRTINDQYTRTAGETSESQSNTVSGADVVDDHQQRQGECINALAIDVSPQGPTSGSVPEQQTATIAKLEEENHQLKDQVRNLQAQMEAQEKIIATTQTSK